MSAQDAFAQHPQTLLLDAAGFTDVGRKRSINEDNFLVEHPVYVVADGMGGHAAGERASAAIVEQFRQLCGRGQLDPAEVVDIVLAADDAVRDLKTSGERPAGSTLTGVVVVEQAGLACWMIMNVGDSRVYRLSDGVLEQLTVDHSTVQEMIDQGRLTPEQGLAHSGRNVITRAIGADYSAADYWLMPVTTGDRMLVCSDGLTRELDDAALLSLLREAPSAESAAQTLVRAAVQRGGRDNVTVVVVDALAGGLMVELDEPTLSPITEGEWADTQTIEMPERVDG